MHPVPLVATTRGDTVENIHYGSVAVVDSRGKLLFSAGDPGLMTFARSALKAFQALPFMLSDGPARLGLTPPELALLCASHSGEDMHVRGVRAILGKIGLGESDLECGCGVPLYIDALGQPAPQQAWTPLHHNCSGKHAGFLAWCRLQGQPTAGYVGYDHPLQQAIRDTLFAQAGATLPAGIDGCSAPNYAMPLSMLAQLYARLGQGAADPALGSVLGDLYYPKTGHPEMVSGQARSDLAYMDAGDGDWVSKVGADAVQAIGLRAAGIGIAVKITDGAARALHPATVSVLDQLGVLDERKRAILEPYRQPLLRNARDAVVGDIRPLFQLQRASA